MSIKAKYLGLLFGACLHGASFAAWSASATSASIATGDTRQSVNTVTTARQDATTVRDVIAPASASVAHLARQYALHRSSVYLYNPQRDEEPAGAPVGTTVEQ